MNTACHLLQLMNGLKNLKRNSMKTAVEWLWDELECLIPAECQEAYVKAKEMEKKQSEKMYSEEDLRQAFRDGQSNMHYSDIFGLDSSLTEQQWFENFKKK